MKKYLIITTALTTICFAPEIMAQCTENTDCASLGYTETSCPEGGLKCPLGNYWYCPAEAEWGKCNGSAKNCNIGDILYSDGTCSSQNISGKTPIAVVVYKSANGNCAQAMALKPIGSYKWSSEYVDIPNLTDFGSDYRASTDYQSCTNTVIITAAGDKSKYPAAWAAKNYNTAGTESGDWCLPAAGIMTSIKNNISTINNGFNLIRGAQIGRSFYYWSSSEAGKFNAWYMYCRYNCELSKSFTKTDSSEVRPVLEF